MGAFPSATSGECHTPGARLQPCWPSTMKACAVRMSGSAPDPKATSTKKDSDDIGTNTVELYGRRCIEVEEKMASDPFPKKKLENANRRQDEFLAKRVGRRLAGEARLHRSSRGDPARVLPCSGFGVQKS